MSEYDAQLNAAQDTWRVFRIMAEFVDGFEVMGHVGLAAAIFGSARTPPDDKYYQMASDLAERLVKEDYAVITGGGPGIMEAGNRGAFDAGGKSIGLNISLPMEQVANPHQTISLNFHYFFCRKVMFLKYAQALICFPGGFGTMDEFFESMTLIQTKKTAKFPVVLIGHDFWDGLVAWMRHTMLDQFANVSPEDMDLFLVTDDIDEAVRHVCQHTARPDASGARNGAALEKLLSGRLTAEGTAYGEPVARHPRAKQSNR